MNRRTLLQSAGVAAVVGLAGCIDGVQEHFGLQGVIPMEIHSEAERTHNLYLEARERETDRQSYQQSYSITPGETVGPPHLDATDQSVRIARIENDEEADVEVVSVTPETELVVIRVYDDRLEAEARTEDADGNETESDDTDDTDPGGNGTDE